MDIYRKIDSYRGYTYCVRRTMPGTICCYIDVARDGQFDDIASTVKRRGGRFNCFDAEPVLEKLNGFLDMPGGITYVALGFPRFSFEQREPFDDDLVIGYDHGHYYDIDMSLCDGKTFTDARMLQFGGEPILWSKISEADAEKELHGIIDSLI